MTSHVRLSRSWSRAFGPGPSAATASALLALALCAVGISFAVVLATRHSPRAAAAYGGLPAWLPKQKLPVDRVVTASAAHPWRAIEGDTVLVDVSRGRVLAAAVGPDVPEEGNFPVPATTPCTFTVSLRGEAGAVPLGRGSFTIVDELGHLHRPHLVGAAPARIRTGQRATITLRDVLPTGGGRLQWSPAGTGPIVSWDFDVEID